jgi:hypothetical protein
MPEQITQQVGPDPTVNNKGSKDKWDKWETLSKIVGAVSIPILGLAVTLILQNQAENNRQAQLYVNIMAEREKADSEVRAKMFDFLMTRYFISQSSPSEEIEEFRRKIMFLELLQDNFQEYFSAKPLFGHLFRQIKDVESKQGSKEAGKRWKELKTALIDVGKHTSSRQLTSLAPVALIIKEIFVPLSLPDDPQVQSSHRVPLYPTQGLEGIEALFGTPKAPGSQFEKPKSGQDRYSITLTVKHLEEDSATLSVWVYQDKYNGNKFDAQNSQVTEDPLDFDVSYFSTPYMDNTRLSNGNRFAVIYSGCMDRDGPEFACEFPVPPGRKPQAQFQVVVFKEGFLSQRDRPYVDQLIDKIGSNKKGF